MTKQSVLLTLIALIAITSCKEKDKFERDLGDSKLTVEIHRLDQDLFNVPEDGLEAHVAHLLQEYDKFLELYSYQIIRIGSPYHADYVNRLSQFMNHETVRLAKQEVDKTFGSLAKEQELLSSAFTYYHYYFPEKVVPAVYTYVGGFNESVVLADSLLGIGLDKYLGNDCEYYAQLGFPAYMQQNMKPEMIPYDAVRGWVSSEFVFNDSVNNVLSHMVYQGIMQYTMDALFPKSNEALKYGFTNEELAWCKKNQRSMWEYLIEHEILFSTNHMTITKYIEPAPFTQGFPEVAPGRAIIFLGREIVGAYMEKNPEVTLPQLLALTDYNQIFREAKYKP
jgi:hypothetical protein